MQLELKNVSKSYRDAGRTLTVLENLSFIFPAASSVAIVGKSGVGKSTLLHILGGLDRPSSGSVLLEGNDLGLMGDDELSDFRGKHIGFVFQFHHLLPEFNAVENVAMPLIIGGMDAEYAERDATTVLERVGLSGRLTHRPGQLSGGEQQRVALARALVSGPSVILADEPTGNLDFTTAKEMQELLLEINRELKNLLIVVTHNPELAQSMDTVLEMMPGGNLVRRT